MSGFLIGPSGVAPASGGGGGGTLIWTETASPAAVTTGGLVSPVTFFSVAIGSASSDRFVVVCFQNVKAAGSANGDITAVTIGGVSATRAVGTTGTNQRVTDIWYTNVPTGTTADIVATTTTGWVDGMQIIVGIITGSATTSVSSTTTGAAYPGTSNTNSAAITVATGGVAIICAFADGATGVSTAWTNATKDTTPGDVGYTANSNGVTGTVAHATASATVTEVVTGSAGVSGWVSASFQP